jgi:flavin-binding protein dodecin
MRTAHTCPSLDLGTKPEEATMSEHTYRVTEIVGSSHESLDAAIRNAIKRADATLHKLDWFEVTEIRGHLHDGEVAHFQVGLKIGFQIDEKD